MGRRTRVVVGLWGKRPDLLVFGKEWGSRTRRPVVAASTGHRSTLAPSGAAGLAVIGLVTHRPRGRRHMDMRRTTNAALVAIRVAVLASSLEPVV